MVPSNGRPTVRRSPVSWVDLAGAIDGVDGTIGLMVLNDSKYAFDVYGGEIGVTAVRSPSCPPRAHVTEAGIRYQFQIRRTPIRPGAPAPPGTSAETSPARRAAELNQRPTVLMESAHAGRLPDGQARLGPAGEPGARGGQGFRGWRGPGRPGGRDLRASGPRRSRPAAVATCVEVDIEPFEIRTFRISQDPDVAVRETDLLERPSLGDGDTGAVASGRGATKDAARTKGSRQPL